MANTDSDKPRRKIVVEEVGDVSSTVEITPQEEVHEESKPEPQIDEVAASTVIESEEIKEEPKLEEPIKPQPTLNSEPIQQRVSGPSPLVVIVPGIFLLGALLGGIIFYQKSLDKTLSFNSTPTESSIATPEPSATPESKDVDTEKYEIKILNGSGIKGEAGKAQELLEGDKFKVSSTGNADNYDYTKTVIQAKTDVDKAFLTKLTETLSEVYLVDSKTEALSASSTDSVIVIVGTSKK